MNTSVIGRFAASLFAMASKKNKRRYLGLGAAVAAIAGWKVWGRKK